MRVLSYLTMIKQASSSNFINFERARDVLVTVRRWMTGRRGVAAQVENAGDDISSGEAQWSNGFIKKRELALQKKKEEKKKKSGRWIYARENRENSRSTVGGNSLPFFFPPSPHRDFFCDRNCIHLYSAARFCHVSTRFFDVTCPMFNEASKVIGSLLNVSPYFYINLPSVFTIPILMIWWFYDPNVSIFPTFIRRSVENSFSFMDWRRKLGFKAS